MVKPDREQLVGLLTEDPSHILRAGAQIVAQVHQQPPMSMEGHVTSAYYGPRVGRSIAMGLLAGGLKRKGETVTIWDAGEIVRAKVASPVFYDRDGERMRA
jgi:sarcosine oxidase subunit alpha